MLEAPTVGQQMKSTPLQTGSVEVVVARNGEHRRDRFTKGLVNADSGSRGTDGWIARSLNSVGHGVVASAQRAY